MIGKIKKRIYLSGIFWRAAYGMGLEPIKISAFTKKAASLGYDPDIIMGPHDLEITV